MNAKAIIKLELKYWKGKKANIDNRTMEEKQRTILMTEYNAKIDVLSDILDDIKIYEEYNE